MYKHWYKIAKLIFFDQIDRNIEVTFQSILPGKWSLIEHRKLMPSYNLQQYGSIGLLGDYQLKFFLVQISYEVRKASVGAIKHPYDGYYDDEGNYIPETEEIWKRTDKEVSDEMHRRFEQINKLQNSSLLGFDNRVGNPLLSFRGWIIARPKNENVKDENWDILSSSPSYEGFSDLDTPTEVANFVYDYIKRSFGSDGDSDDPIVTPPSISPVQTPNMTPSLV